MSNEHNFRWPAARPVQRENALNACVGVNGLSRKELSMQSTEFLIHFYGKDVQP